MADNLYRTTKVAFALLSAPWILELRLPTALTSSKRRFWIGHPASKAENSCDHRKTFPETGLTRRHLAIYLCVYG